MEASSSPLLAPDPEAGEPFMQEVRSCLARYLQLWGQFGLPPDVMRQRLKELWAHVGPLMDEIYQEDFRAYHQLQGRVQGLEAATRKLAGQLGVEAMTVEKGQPLFRREEALQEELGRLTRLRRERLQEWERLFEEEKGHRRAMLLSPPHAPGRRRTPPSEADLVQRRKKVGELGEERCRRKAALERGRAELLFAVQQGEWSPDSPLEHDLLAQDPEEVPLSQQAARLLDATLAKLRSHAEAQAARRRMLEGRLRRLWRCLRMGEAGKTEFPDGCRPATLLAMEEEVGRLEEQRASDAEGLARQLRREAEELWDKCHVPEEERSRIQATCEEPSADMLERYEDEIEKWRQLYAEAKPILEKIAKRQQLWGEMLDIESKASDPDRFKNRGGKLLEEEKRRKRLRKELPALENDILRDIEEYELLGGLPFPLHQGCEFGAFVAEQWACRLDRKESEKLERRKRRGSTDSPSSTPTAAKGTPGVTPKKASTKSSSRVSSAGCTPLVNRAWNRLAAQRCSLRGEVVDWRAAVPKAAGQLLPQSLASKGAGKAPSRTLHSPAREGGSENKAAEGHLPGPPGGGFELDGTTYSAFVHGLDQSDVHSSVLEKRRGAKGGKAAARGKRALKKRGSLRPLPKFTPKRGKLGLPFLI